MDTSSSAHGAGSAASSSSSQSSNRWKYEVFLSFRGEDTRKTFTGHLFIALRNAGINTFMDNQLTRGENIQRELDREIEGSRIAVIVFSKRYAESRWCLRELSKIMRCLKDQEGKIVCPIFYDVDPSQVRKQEDSFEEAFQKHEKDEDPNEVKQWREDLKASADLGGWNLKTTADGREGVFIEKIVGDVMGLLRTIDLKEAKHSVGMTFRVQEFSTEYLDVGGSPDVQIIGICGMGGIGKTTLARAVCSNYQHWFSRQCFLEDVTRKQKKMVSLQEQLLRDILKRPDIKISNVAEGTKEIKKRLGSMKVLVVVDDIDDANQLDELAIEHESFGPGSRIIITTRDEHVLNRQKVDKKYKAQAMTKKEALELFSWHAFGNDYPDKEYIELARDIVDYCGGLPLALEVVGHLLATRKSKAIWESTLNKLRNIPDGRIYKTLKLSYDRLLDDHMKGVFLDISCFFIGLHISFVTAILDGCSRFSVEAEITALCDRCLLYIDEEEKLRMHDLIRDMGREIVRAESFVELGKRSRLWHGEDAKSVLRNKLGTEAVEGLTLFLPENSDDEQSFSTEAFKKMWRLKFLQLGNVKLIGSYKHLSKELRLLSWIGFPLEAIPADFDQRNLVCMQLSNSKIVRVWEDSDLLPKKLKHLVLRDCHNLTELPDFSKLPHLKQLDLSGCKGLCGGYHFLAQLKMIEELALSDCNITDGAGLEIIGSLSSLKGLDLGGNGFNRLPILSSLSQLQVLYLNHCTNLQAIPDLPNSLRVLKANYCTALEILPDFSEMSKMWELELKDCSKLKDIPNLEKSLDYMDSIISIHMEGCTSLTDTFKENLRMKNSFGGISLSGNDIPNWLAYVTREDETVKFDVPPSTDYIGGLALGIVYSSDNSDCPGFLTIDVVNRTQRTKFRIWAREATVTASHEYYLWLGNLSNMKLNLKGGNKVLVKAEFYGRDNRIKVNKIGVDIVKWDLFDGRTKWEDYETMSYESDEETTMSYEYEEDTTTSYESKENTTMTYEFEENTDDDILLSNRHVFLCYKTPEAWPWLIEGSKSDPLPKLFASALKARESDFTVKTLLTVFEGREGTKFSDGDVLIYPQMINYRGLKESDVDSFVDDVLVNHKPWASGVREPLTGSHVFVCAHCSREEWNRDSARVLIDKFKEEAELRGLTNQVFVTACYHTGGNKYTGTITIYSPDSNGSMTDHCYIFITPDDVPKLFDKHIGKGEIIERHWRREEVFIEKIIGNIKGLLKPIDLEEAMHLVGMAIREGIEFSDEEAVMDTSTALEASTSSSPSSSSSSPSPYDVFLSFGAEDTRKTFTDHLYWTMQEAGIDFFMEENESIRRGENISDKVKQIIEGSKVSVIVFSSRYADSIWCLEELVQIMECRRILGQMVLPIFYDLSPSDVIDTSAQAFKKHGVRFHEDTDKQEKIRGWRDALIEAANLTGRVFRTTNGYEGMFIREIIDNITRQLKSPTPVGIAFSERQRLHSPELEDIDSTDTFKENVGLFESDEDTEDDTLLGYLHIFLYYKTPEAWPWRIEGSESDPLPKFFTSALKARKNDITIKTLLTVIEGRKGTEFSDGDVLIFPQMIKYRGLKESDVDSFVDDVLVNHKPWASRVQEPLTGSHVFVCTHCSREEWNGDSARVLIDKFEEEAELRGLTNQVFVTACYHTGGHKYAGTLTIYSPDSNGSMTDHWYRFVTPDDVPKLLDKDIGKGEIIERHWRGQIRESCARKDALGKLSSLIGNWEQSDVLAAAAVVGVVATVAVAYSFYRRSG